MRRFESTDSDLPRSPVERYAELWDRLGPACDVAAFLNGLEDADARQRADVLLFDQARRAELGRPRNVEEYLNCCPAVAADPELKLDLVYGEWRRGGSSDLQSRFPELRDELRRQSEVGDWVRRAEASATGATGLGPSPSHETPREPPTDDAPLTVDDFVLEKELGSGGMGTVWQARQKSLNRRVAVKMLRTDIAASRELNLRFLREARAVAQLQHPHIVRIFGIGRTPVGGLFMVMDLVEGTNLSDRLLRSGRFAPHVAARTAARIAEALAHAHELGIVHRDIKPSNILLDRNDHPMVVDFGLAKLVHDREPAVSSPHQVVGTPKYMAPEQADPARGPVSPATDIYGLGCVLYAMLTGQGPVEGGSTGQILSKVLLEVPKSPRLRFPDIPPALEAACLKCLSKEPSDRFASALDARTALESACRAEPAAGPAAPSHRTAWVVAAGAAMLVAAAAVIAFNRRDAAEPQGPDKPDPPPGSPAAPADASIAWTIDVYREKQANRRIRLTDMPTAVYTGDSLRIRVRLSRPAYPQLFWIDGDGKVQRVHPTGSAPSVKTAELVWPPETSDGAPVVGAIGTELAVLIVGDEPPPATDPDPAALKPARPFPDLEGDFTVSDDKVRRQEIDPDTGERKRGLGKPEPLVDTALGALRAWRQQLPADRTVSYFAVAHRER